eukprot:CAMPEP_0181287868 /NCGR_PEP_ID=MMETSP1101-20121128/22_1 /TAXON_ID=46948 /ORGANISM="Rhodomonas abbreviata, Strain Caron Lab Isolate" /LENGTH=678 /DNA_ID=CAMNT_0023391939 /DNA_START=27 /DNA_END=2060 /DNA_ORIENTATION=+
MPLTRGNTFAGLEFLVEAATVGYNDTRNNEATSGGEGEDAAVTTESEGDDNGRTTASAPYVRPGTRRQISFDSALSAPTSEHAATPAPGVVATTRGGRPYRQPTPPAPPRSPSPAAVAPSANSNAASPTPRPGSGRRDAGTPPRTGAEVPLEQSGSQFLAEDGADDGRAEHAPSSRAFTHQPMICPYAEVDGFRVDPDVIVTDAAMAAWNACDVVLPERGDERPRQHIKCAEHIRRSIGKGLGDNPEHVKWANYKEHHAKFQRDFTEIKNKIFFAELVPLCFEMMLEQWRAQGEHEVAAAMQDVWGDCKFSRAQANVYGVGGLAPDNNALEAKNGAQKLDTHRRRKALNQFIIWMETWLRNESKNDAAFGMGGSWHGRIWKRKFFRTVRRMVQPGPGEAVSFMKLSFKIAGTDTLVVPSQSTIRALLLARVPNTVAAMRRGLQVAEGGEGWLVTFQSMMQEPAAFVKQRRDDPDAEARWKLGDVIAWSTAFHVLRPMEAGRQQAAMLSRIQRTNGMEVDTDLTRGGAVLKTCTCPTYLHVMWCEHVHAYAMHDGIVSGWPQNMDPTRVEHGVGRPDWPKPGRPRKAGSAYDRDDRDLMGNRSRRLAAHGGASQSGNVYKRVYTPTQTRTRGPSTVPSGAGCAAHDDLPELPDPTDDDELAEGGGNGAPEDQIGRDENG